MKQILFESINSLSAIGETLDDINYKNPPGTELYLNKKGEVAWRTAQTKQWLNEYGRLRWEPLT